jgi:hypothetical protein
MTRYRFALIISGEVDAPSEDHARQQVLMGLSMSVRLSASPQLETALTLQEQPEPVATPLRDAPVPVAGEPQPPTVEADPPGANGTEAPDGSG